MQQYIGNFSEYIEQLAYTSLYDLTHATKAMAEQEFTKMVFQLHPSQFENLMESGSENVVLAFGAVLLKSIPVMGEQLFEVLSHVGEVLMHWYQSDGTLLRRHQGDRLKLYVENTFGQFMGNGLRALLQSGGKEVVEGLLAGTGVKPHYRLFLYFRFIESYSNTVEIVNYVDYRVYLSTFQDAFLPRIFEALMPFFLSISEAMDVDELAQLHSALSLSVEERACVLELSVKSRFTELVFELLELVTAFRFNISIREYEEFQEFEQVQISFPEELLEKLLRNSFLDVLYGVLLQLMRTTEFKYQRTCLNCLQKVLLAKITYLTRDEQTRFVFTNMRGVLGLLRLVLNNSCAHRLNAYQIIRAAYNFVHTFGLDDVDARSEREGRLLGVLADWLEVCRALPLFLLQFDPEPLNCDNQLFIASVELNAEIANELKINRVECSHDTYTDHYRTFTSLFLNRFLGNAVDILAGRSFSFEELKRSANELLASPKLLSTFSYGETFTLIHNYATCLFQPDIKDISVGNLLLLLTEMLRDHRFLQESVFGKGLLGHSGMEEIGGELSLFSEILARAYTFVLGYLNGQSQPFLYLNNAMVLFVSVLLDRCSRRLRVSEGGDPAVIQDEVYRRLRGWVRVADDEDFLLRCLFVLGRLVRCEGMVNIDFIFQQLHNAIKLIKSNMQREHFKHSAIYAQMWELFQQLALQPMPIEFMRFRVLLFKTICVLSFDDALDEYRGSIRNTVGLLCTTAANGEWVRLLYDLTGIFESIDGRVIFRYFVRTLEKELRMDVVMNHLFHLGFAQPAAYLKDVIHLSWYMVENYNGRIDPGDDLCHVYNTLSIVVTYWNLFLQQDKLLEEAEDAVSELYHGICRVFGSKHINLCVIDTATSQFRPLLKILTYSMCKCLENIDSNDELAGTLFELGQVLTGTVPKALFSLPDLEITQRLNAFVKEVMKRLSVSFSNMAAGVLGDKWLEQMLKIVERYYDFLHNYRGRPHLFQLTVGVNWATGDAEHKAAFLELAIKIAMEFRTHFASITQLVANICVLLVKIFHIQAHTIIGGLGLNDNSDAEELSRIFKNANEDIEDYEWLTAQMKDWLKVKTRFIPSSDDY